MALSFARTLARASRPAARNFVPLVPPRLNLAPPLCVAGPRSFSSVAKYTRSEAVEKLDRFHGEVLGANWADYLYLVYNVPFWEAEYESLTLAIQPYLHEAEVGEKFKTTQEMMDVLYKCEDVRDHVNELCELATRASGFMGTGWQAMEKVENVDEVSKHCMEAYDSLLTTHPAFKPKIEQTVGHGLAILRSKHKFRWSTMHRFFY